jgi:hypothetical protein
MADSNPASGAPAKAAPVKRTMAPAARPPGGVDDHRPTDMLRNLSPAELQDLRNRVDQELRARAAQPTEPSFGVSAGTAAELEDRDRRIKAGEDPDKIVVASPFTGRRLDADGEPVDDDDNKR